MHALSKLSNLLFQRIMGKKFGPALRFFGQAIHGDIDLKEDGLPDVVIGSQGKVVVLRYKYCVHYVYVTLWESRY